jgi:hypothetical protein
MTVNAHTFKVEDGIRNLVIHFVAEITAGDEQSFVPIIVPSTLNVYPGTQQKCTHVSIERIQAKSINIEAAIYGATTSQGNILIATFPPNFVSDTNYRHTQPLEPSPYLPGGPGFTGTILINTNNTLGPTGDQLDGSYSMRMWCRKKYE